MVDKVLSWAIVALTIAVFGYAGALAWGNGDLLLLGLAVFALILCTICAIRWRA
jgi:hypothetical protein